MSSNWLLLLIPIIGAAIGWITNYLAVKMLFAPKKPVNLLFFTVQGIFPKRQAQIAQRVGEMVANDLLSTTEIKEKLLEGDYLEKLLHQVEHKLDDYLNNVLPEKYKMLSIFVGNKRKSKIKDAIISEVAVIAPVEIDKYLYRLESEVNIEAMISEKVAAFSPERLEKLLFKILEKEFKFIELVGAVLGFFIGLLQVGITLLAS